MSAILSILILFSAQPAASKTLEILPSPARVRSETELRFTALVREDGIFRFPVEAVWESDCGDIKDGHLQTRQESGPCKITVESEHLRAQTRVEVVASSGPAAEPPTFADHPAIRVLHWKLRKGRFLSDSASVRVQCEHAQARKIEIVVLRGDGSQARRSWSPCAFGKRADFNADLGYGEARWIELRLLGPQRSELARIRRDVRFPD